MKTAADFATLSDEELEQLYLKEKRKKSSVSLFVLILNEIDERAKKRVLKQNAEEKIQYEQALRERFPSLG